MNGETWEPPRCVHGRILLGCPHDDCPTQVAYLDQIGTAQREWEEAQQRSARALVRGLLAPPPSSVGADHQEGNPR